MKKSVLFCMGLSGSGKSHFIQNNLLQYGFYKLRSATTRPMRNGEADGREYFFRDEHYFDITPMATRLWVNEQFWQPGKPKWLYGVPESEILANIDKSLVYDVIQPKYARQMIDWFTKHDLHSEYSFKTLYFVPPENNFEIARSRANMPDDNGVRTQNTCAPIDFLRANLDIDFLIKSSAAETLMSSRLLEWLNTIHNGR